MAPLSRVISVRLEPSVPKEPSLSLLISFDPELEKNTFSIKIVDK